MKIIAFYLPQFYEFKENDIWWGKGFTEWTNVKKAKPLFRKHYQPTLPMNNNFYSLENIDTFKWQIQLAKKYGVYGFCFYHYWFGNGKQLMEKPVDAFLEHKELDFPFCLSWANHNWTRTWVGGDQDVLMDVQYGNQSEWKRHFSYLLPFFLDKRYIYIDDKPLFVIYGPQDIPELEEMKNVFISLAKDNGLKGITFVAQQVFEEKKIDSMGFDYYINYEPNRTMQKLYRSGNKRFLPTVNRTLQKFCYNHHILWHLSQIKNLYSYDEAWKLILSNCDSSKKAIPGAFVRFDSSPRKGKNGVVFYMATPDKFEKYMIELIKQAKHLYEHDFIFLTAWNEWGEGAYMEPDEKYQLKFLEALKNALIKTNSIM